MELLANQRRFSGEGKTKPVDFRIQQLKNLLEAIQTHEGKISHALKKDLGKSETESYIAEVYFSIEEIKYTLKNIRSWMKPKRVGTPVMQAVGKSYIHPEPLGIVLIIGPWNYPFQLCIAPLIGAIAAGNCAIIKPSELAPETSKVLAEIITKTFAKEFVAVVEGGAESSQALLKEKFDHIFFTGGTAIGKIVMQEAAKSLTPVTLELGGKSPCIVDKETDLEVSARRITWGKYFNAGQTCVAPDYLLLPKGTTENFLGLIQKNLQDFFGADPEKSPDYGRIINQRHYDRLKSYLSDGKIAFGGKFSDAIRYLAPTAVTGASWDRKLMQDEIFGPILPILEYGDLKEAIQTVNNHPKPLALYFFSKNKANQTRVIEETSFGGGCMNDTLMHLSNPKLPFGGVGESGMGAYHGKYSFDTFSHKKSVFYKSFFPDLKLRYPPYEGKLAILKKIMR